MGSKKSMSRSPFHIYYTARELASYVNGEDKLLPAFASSDVKIYPYQIAAALFALRSPYLKGVVLADEGSLGKTYEALLIATERWYEGKDKQLIILPPNLIKQWIEKIENSFSIPYLLIDTEARFNTYKESNPFDQEVLIISSYDFATAKAEYIEQIKWDLVIFDEASCLSKGYIGENKTATALKQATDGAFRLLLTPTPITMSIMDIYGLLWVIDETILPDEKSFYDRYFRKPENYGELSEWVSKYCFRTLKSQVSDYVNFSNRIPYTVSYELTEPEKRLYEKLEKYLALPKKAAYPKMEQYDLSLMYYHTVSSSAQAFCRTINGAISRLDEGVEKELLVEIGGRCQAVGVSGKMEQLLVVLRECFLRLGRVGVAKKAIIFTDNRVTQGVLRDLLIDNGFGGVLTYSGQNSRDYSIMEQFRNDLNIQIVISTDEAAKGLDLEFCSVVVNYDMLYNAVELEQRITRCHRQGQQSDVLVVNLLGKDNFSDVRILELINKRVLQFDGIFGLSDTILGNFDTPLDDVLSQVRHRDIIKDEFRQNIDRHKIENKQLVQTTAQTIFTSFTPNIAQKITLTPEYIEDRIDDINKKLWEIVVWYFEDFNNKYPETPYIIDHEAKTITAPDGDLPDLFYYWTGTRNRPYRSLKQYGMAADFKPYSGRITLASVFGRHILNEICCAYNGEIKVDAAIEPCEIALYSVGVVSKAAQQTDYYVLVGRTETGKILPDSDCREIMDLPLVDYFEGKIESKVRRDYNFRIFTVDRDLKPCPLDGIVPTDHYIQKSISGKNSVTSEQIGLMRRRTAIAKTALERDVEKLKSEIKSTEKELSNATDRIGKIHVDKRLKVLRNDFRKREDALFMDRMRLDLELEKEIEEFAHEQEVTVNVLRHYHLVVGGRG